MRVLLALLAFGATSAALLAMTSQLAPGWRPAGIETPTNPRPADPAARRQVHEVRQTSAEITAEGSHNLAAWIATAESSEARAMPGLVLVHGAGLVRPRVINRDGAGVRRSRYGRDHLRQADSWVFGACSRLCNAGLRTPFEPLRCLPTRRVSIRDGST